MSDFTDLQDQAPEDGLDRRQMIKRAALVGGALVWATPVVQSIGGTAFATTGSPPGGGGNGAPSYVFVFFDCGDHGNFVVKYGQDGNAEVCGATSQNVSQDGTQAVYDKFDAIYAAHGPYEAGACPADVTSGLDPVDNDLVITLDGSGCTIVDWFLHDGSCQNTGDDKFRWQGDGETPAVASVDPSNGGTWQFQKCAP